MTMYTIYLTNGTVVNKNIHSVVYYEGNAKVEFSDGTIWRIPYTSINYIEEK